MLSQKSIGLSHWHSGPRVLVLPSSSFWSIQSLCSAAMRALWDKSLQASWGETSLPLPHIGSLPLKKGGSPALSPLCTTPNSPVPINGQKPSPLINSICVCYMEDFPHPARETFCSLSCFSIVDLRARGIKARGLSHISLWAQQEKSWVQRKEIPTSLSESLSGEMAKEE